MSSLSREAIATAAIGLADAEGLDAVSMRRVATALGVGTMSLYHYVRTKDELLALMGDAIMGEFLIPEDEMPEGWRGGLREVALRTKASYDRHPWMLLGMLMGQAGPPGPNLMNHANQSIGTLVGLDLSASEVLHLTGAIDEYVAGFVFRAHAQEVERADDVFGPTMDAWFDDVIDSGEYPHFRSLFGPSPPTADQARALFAEVDSEDRFEPGLELMLDGIAAYVDRAGRR